MSCSGHGCIHVVLVYLCLKISVQFLLQTQQFNAETEDLIGQLKSELDSMHARNERLSEECNELHTEKKELEDTVQVCLCNVILSLKCAVHLCLCIFS